MARNRKRGNSKMNEADLGGGQPQIQLGPENIMECPDCGNGFFIGTMALFNISALQSGSGKPELVPQPGPFVCLQCQIAVQPQNGKMVKIGGPEDEEVVEGVVEEESTPGNCLVLPT